MARVIVDLSVPLTNNMPAHKFFPRPVILPHFTHDEMETWGNGTPEDPLGGCTTFISMMDHVGTHVDASVTSSAAARPSIRCRSTCSWARPCASICGTSPISATSTRRISRTPRKRPA